MDQKRILLFLFIFLTGTLILNASSFRVAQLPNGTKFGCANCHVSPQGGGTRNAFGQIVEQKYLNGQGNVIWGAELANLDSDGDGISNGLELQDANGSWRIGQTNPGSSSLVTNPGDKNSKPTDIDNMELVTTYRLSQNYPNPFNPSTTIKFSIPSNAFVNLEVFDITGKSVAQLINNPLTAGEHSVRFNAEGLSSGTYFYRIQANNFLATRKFILIK